MKLLVYEIVNHTGKKYGGVLTNWSFHSISSNIEYVLGTVVGQDPTGRFDIGTTVRTSNVVFRTIYGISGYIIETANTVYILDNHPNIKPLSDDLAAFFYLLS